MSQQEIDMTTSAVVGEEEDVEETETETELETETESEEEEEVLDPWRHSIFGCCDHGVAQCCVMFFCDCCTYGKAVSHNLYGGSGCCYFLCCTCGHLCCCCNRTRMRSKYKLEAHNIGASLGDCLTVTCCCCCARCQQILELETREGLLIGPCSVRRGQPLRTRLRAANTGGTMRRSKVAPVDSSKADVSEKQRLTSADAVQPAGDLQRSMTGNSVDERPVPRTRTSSARNSSKNKLQSPPGVQPV